MLNSSTMLVCLRTVRRLYFFSREAANAALSSSRERRKGARFLGLFEGGEVVVDLVAGDQHLAREHLWHHPTLPFVTALARGTMLILP